MPIDIDPKYLERIKNAYFMWFTTVREDGMPQPTPIWFIWENDSILFYTIPTSQKVKNLRQNPKVALTYGDDKDGEIFTVIMGEAVIDDKTPLPVQNAAYMEKYAQGIIDINMNNESFNQTYTMPIRVTPIKVRGD